MEQYIQLILKVIDNFLSRTNDEENLLLLVNNFNINEKLKNHILMNVIGISKVNLDISQAGSYVMQGENYILKQKSEYYQLLIAFHSMFVDDNIGKGYKLLSQISSFINNNRQFSPLNIPQIAADNLEPFFINDKVFSITEENEIWQKLKIPYMPTLFYEAGLISIYSPVDFAQKKVAPLKDFIKNL